MEQIKKNTVSGENQLKEYNFVTMVNGENSGKRILFVGNSITRHGVLEDIGWYHDYGMAASSIDKDYVHIVADEVLKSEPNAVFQICQVAKWELNYKNGSEHLEAFEAARNFNADIIVLRFIENCAPSDFDAEIFYNEYKKLINYLDFEGKAKLIFTTGFWKHPGDDIIIKISKEYGAPVEYLGNLGEQDEMKAIGLFEHSGVANHPGDKGMRAIAELILKHI